MLRWAALFAAVVLVPTGCSSGDVSAPAAPMPSVTSTATPIPRYAAQSTSDLPPYTTTGYVVRPVPVGKRPFDTGKMLRLDDEREVDSRGVAIWERNGRRYPHPVVYAQYGLDALNSYRLSRQRLWLNRAIANGRALLADSVMARGALFFRYTHTFPLHNRKDDVMTPPWYSAMAQGIALALFVRLYEQTNDAKWSRAADATFASLNLNRTKTGPWVTFVDTSGYLWLEEYAKDPPMRVLNGHNFALFGVWDYARATGSVPATSLYDAAATTVAHYIGSYRRPGQPSRYSLRLGVPNQKYHRIHTAQLLMLARLTGDTSFSTWSAGFAADFA